MKKKLKNVQHDGWENGTMQDSTQNVRAKEMSEEGAQKGSMALSLLKTL